MCVRVHTYSRVFRKSLPKMKRQNRLISRKGRRTVSHNRGGRTIFERERKGSKTAGVAGELEGRE